MTRREPAPPYAGEGPFALWHVSEEPALGRFVPRVARTSTERDALVWAIDTRHLPLFWFPRDCPRATFWAGPRTTDDDVAGFLEGDRARRVHVIERVWETRVRFAHLFAYRMPPQAFAEHPTTAGYWTSRETVEALDRVELDDLVGRHARAGIELRWIDELLSFWDGVIASTLEFSGIRLRNAQPRLDTSGASAPT